MSEFVRNRQPLLSFDARRLADLSDQRQEKEWLRKYRRRFFERYEAMPWPHTQMEEWRRTNISHINVEEYPLALGHEPDAILTPLPADSALAGNILFRGNHCVQVRLRPDLAQAGVVLLSINQLAEENPFLLQRFLSTRPDDQLADRFEAMNQSFFNHGLVLYVPRRVEITAPILAIFEATGQKNASIPYLLVVLEEGSRACLVHQYQSSAESASLRNGLTDLRVADSARLHYIEEQWLAPADLNFSYTRATIQAGSELCAGQAFLGSSLTKSRFQADIVGSGSNLDLAGLYFGSAKQHFDIRTVQHHTLPQAVSRLMYKGAVRDQARTVYQGLIKVFRAAQQSDAYLANRNLILSERARADSIPTLEIEANDVKCSHGATAGRINEDDIFYLMSRGIPRLQARELLVQGFFEDIIQKFPDLCQDRLRQGISAKMMANREVEHV